MANNGLLRVNIDEKINQLERKESRLLQELGTVSNRVDRVSSMYYYPVDRYSVISPAKLIYLA